MATRELFGPAEEFRAWVRKPEQTFVRAPSYHAARLPHWFPGGDSWPAASPARLAMLEDLSTRFRLLEDQSTGTRVGIGVATGADEVFIKQHGDCVDVEADRLLPLAMVRDLTSGVLERNGAYLVNPWNTHGGLVLSKVAEAFVTAYAVRMRGGTLRFQAQYLRKIRLPDLSQISEADRVAFANAFDRRDVQAATRAALRAYSLTELPG